MNSYTYTGREWDKETGLYYYRARYYDPMEGRFISKDPIAILANIRHGSYNITENQYIDSIKNSYAYVKNNPINLVDPKGLSPFSCLKAAWDARRECGPKHDEAIKEGYKLLDWCEQAQFYCNGVEYGDPINPKPTADQCKILGRNQPIDQTRGACLNSPQVTNMFKQSFKCMISAIKEVIECAP